MKYSEKIRKDHEARHLSPEQISAEKNGRSKARGEARKQENISRHDGYRAKNAKLTPAERIASLDRAFGKGKGAGKERVRLAEAVKVEAEKKAKSETKKQAKPVDKKGRAK